MVWSYEVQVPVGLLARFLVCLSLFVGAFVVGPAPAAAHRDDYIDETFVYMTLARREFELELWVEAREDPAHRSQAWYTVAFEHGVTSRWTLDGAGQWLRAEGRLGFGRFRTETRYRFANEGEWPLDLATSAEYEYESRAATGGEAEHTLTARLVISRDLTPKLNTTVNLAFPISLTEGDLSFAYALGVRYPAEGFARVGTELKGEPSVHVATVFPQLWLAPREGMTVKFGTGIGLTDSTDRWVVRGVFEVEF